MRQVHKFMLLALGTILGACNDGAVAPSSGTRAGSPASLPITNGTNATLSQTDTTRFSIVIDPSTTTTSGLGEGNTVVFPAGAICDLSSSYGPTEWDKPCTVATAPVTVNVKAWLTANNHPAVDFSPNVRFSPDAPVTINFTDEAAVDIPWSKIKYCYTASSCVDESVNDASLLTQKDAASGKLYRRVKHFSGYTVDASNCNPNDPSTWPPGMDGCPSGARGLGGAGTLQRLVHAALRRGALPQSVSQSATIGQDGGEISIPEAGLTVTFPRNAVTSDTRITVTARKGRMLAYSFQPHGIQFNVPVKVTQSLGNADDAAVARFLRMNAQAAYVGDDVNQLSDADDSGSADEILDTMISTKHNTISFYIWHFSSYLLCSD